MAKTDVHIRALKCLQIIEWPAGRRLMKYGRCGGRVGVGWLSQNGTRLTHRRSYMFHTVAPLCRLGQIQTYNIARQETAKIVCELESNPNDVHFTWKFNTSSSENLDLPASLIAVDRAKSVAHYTPMTEQVRAMCVMCVCVCSCVPVCEWQTCECV